MFKLGISTIQTHCPKATHKLLRASALSLELQVIQGEDTGSDETCTNWSFMYKPLSMSSFTNPCCFNNLMTHLFTCKTYEMFPFPTWSPAAWLSHWLQSRRMTKTWLAVDKSLNTCKSMTTTTTIYSHIIQWSTVGKEEKIKATLSTHSQFSPPPNPQHAVRKRESERWPDTENQLSSGMLLALLAILLKHKPETTVLCRTTCCVCFCVQSVCLQTNRMIVI